MAKTAAIRVLEALACEYSLHEYKYVDRGGTSASAVALGVEEHSVIKTLIFENDSKSPLIVLMHGDMQVSTKALARHLGAKHIAPCKPQTAQAHSGYQVGGTSPFGTRKLMPVYMQETIAALPWIYINAGKRGLLCKLTPETLIGVLQPTLLAIAQNS